MTHLGNDSVLKLFVAGCIGLALVAGSCAFAFVGTPPKVQFLGVGQLPEGTLDATGLVGCMENGQPLNLAGALGSGAAYTGRLDQYWFLSDRGPQDGAIAFPCRYHVCTVHVQPGSDEPVRITLVDSHLLKDADEPLVGAAAALDVNQPGNSLRFDPEGLAPAPNGNLFVCEEYLPAIAEFLPSGELVRRLPLPGKFLPGNYSAISAEELPPHSTQGRQPNRGFESLTISADGQYLYSMVQSPLLQDGAMNAAGERSGRMCRILEIQLATGKTREFFYPLDHPSLGVSELLWVSPGVLCVLERDGLAGLEAAVKKIYLADIGAASDVSNVSVLADGTLPSGTQPAQKRLLVDLMSPEFPIAGETMPEKFEGLTWGAALADGRRLLLVSTDNDFVPGTAAMEIYAFGIPQEALEMGGANGK